MSPFALALAYLAARPLRTALHVLLLAAGVGTMALLLLAASQAEERLARDARPVDLVAGAKGSPLQLILSAVLHVDVPTGNVPWSEVQALARHPMVAQAVPVSLGDSYRGFRIVGTEPAFLGLYGGSLAQGRVFDGEMEAVVGAEVARRTGLAPGGAFAGAHGLAAGASAHAGEDYRVVGVLAPSGTVLDRLVLTSLESVWHVHGSHGEAARKDVTALLVRYRTPLAAATLPRHVNAQTSMQAASPAYETARLMNLVGIGLDALRAFALLLLGCAALSVVISLASALQERREDLALLRMLGARPRFIFGVLASEGVTLVVAGVILGLAFGHAAAEILGRWMARADTWSVTGMAWAPHETGMTLAVVLAGIAACLLPAIQAYRRAAMPGPGP